MARRGPLASSRARPAPDRPLPATLDHSGEEPVMNKPAPANLSQWHNLTGTELALITSR
jgi:hypothetical protein